MSEEEQAHSPRVENRKLTISVIMAVFGMIAGLVSLGVLCYLLYLSIIKGNTKVALGIVAIIATAVAIFVLNKRRNNSIN
jgi:hypothetical protein